MASSIIQTPEMALLSRVEAALAEVKQQVEFFRNSLGDANEDQQTMTEIINQNFSKLKSDFTGIRSHRESAANALESEKTAATEHTKVKKAKVVAVEAKEKALEVREERQETKEKTLEERERILREREKMLDEREKRLEDRAVRIGDEEKRLDQMGKQAGEKTAAADRQIETAQRKEKEAEEKSAAADTATAEAQKQAASQEGELKGQREAAQSFLNQAMQRISNEDASLNAKRAKLDKDTEEAEELANSYQVEVRVKDADLHDRKRALDKTYEELQRRKAILENREAKIKSMADKVKNDLALENRWLDDGQEQMRRETALATRNSRMAERYLQQATTYHEGADKYLSEAKDLHTRSLEWSLLANERSDQVRSLFADTNDLFGRLKDFHSTESRIKTWRQHYDGLEGLQISIKKHMEAADRRDDKAKELMADVQRSTADAIGKLTSGSNSASDAFRDLTDRMAATSVRESRPTRAAVTSTEPEAISTETGATIPAEGSIGNLTASIRCGQ